MSVKTISFPVSSFHSIIFVCVLCSLSVRLTRILHKNPAHSSLPTLIFHTRTRCQDEEMKFPFTEMTTERVEKVTESKACQKDKRQRKKRDNQMEKTSSFYKQFTLFPKIFTKMTKRQPFLQNDTRRSSSF